MFLSRSALLTISLLAVPARATDADAVRFPASFFAAFHPNNALDMVRRIPGFGFDAGDATMRGLSEAAGNVVLDGKRIADKTFTLDQVLERIPAAQVDRIELVRGGGGIDMLGQPVVANIVRRAATGTTQAVTTSAGVFADGRVTPGVTIERSRSSGAGRSFSISASLSRYVEVNKGDGARVRTDSAGAPIEQAQVKAAAGGSTGYAVTALELPVLRGQLRLNGTLTWTDYRDRQQDRRLLPDSAITRLHENLGGLLGGQANGEAGAHFSRSFGAQLDSETTALLRLGRKSYASLLDAPAGTTRFSERDRTIEASARTQWRYRIDAAWSAAFSVEGAYNQLRVASGLAFDDYDIPLPDAHAIVSETRFDGGGEVTWKPAPGLEIVAGSNFERSSIRSRADGHRQRTYSYPKPRLRIAFAPTPRQQLRLRVQREVGQLDFTNFVAAATLDKQTVSAGNSSIRPDNRWIAEATYEWRAGFGAALALTWRHSWLRDVLDRVPVRADDGSPAFDAPGNIGSGRQDDLIGSATVPLGIVGLHGGEFKLSLNYRRSRVTDPTTGDRRVISNQKPLELTADFHQDLPRWKAAWGATLDVGYRTRTYLFNEVDRNRASPLLTIFADYNPRANLSFHVEASDVLGRNYRRTILSYAGARDVAPLAYIDGRRLSLGPAIILRVRRAF